MLEKTVNNNPYLDMIIMEYHGTRSRTPMGMIERAAQFSPFAALTGYDSAIKETARLTDERIELDEAEKAVLDEKIRILQNRLVDKPEIEFVYFQPDERKLGGSYISVVGIVKKFDLSLGVVILEDGGTISTRDILEIKGTIFQELVY